MIMKRFWHISLLSIICWVFLLFIWRSTTSLWTDSFLFTQWADDAEVRNIDSLWIDTFLFEQEILFEVQEQGSLFLENMVNNCGLPKYTWSLEHDAIRVCDTHVLFEDVDAWDVSIYLTPELDQRLYRWNTFTADVVLPLWSSSKSLSLEWYVFDESQVPSHLVTITAWKEWFLYEIALLTSEWRSYVYQEKIPLNTSLWLWFWLSDSGAVIFVSGDDVRETSVVLPGEIIIGIRGYEKNVWLSNLLFSSE
jgi:hypothetical protein